MHDTRTDRPASLIVSYDSAEGAPCFKPSAGLRTELVDWGRSKLPGRAHLFVGTWDHAELDAVWWDWEGRDGSGTTRYDLFARFNASRCPSFVLLPAVKYVEPTDDALRPQGSPVFLTWEGAEGEAKTWRDWLRAALTYEVIVRNSLAVPVRLAVTSNLAVDSSLTLGAGEESVIKAPLGASLMAERTDSPNTGQPVWRGVVLGDVDEGVRRLEVVEGSLAEHEAKTAALAERSKLLNLRDQDTSFRHVAILRQPPVMPLHSPRGEPISSYKLVDMPKSLVERILSFYGRHRAAPEPYPAGVTGINAHEVATGMVNYDMEHQERQKLALEIIKPLVEEWAQMPLEFTALYGVREYYRGAELRKHVDRVSTHVYSVIIHVARKGVDEDWPLEVYDFDGAVKTISMGPGQMLFYQSAKLVHGRPTPLRGDLYANLFCHFRPAAGWEFKMEAGDQLYRNGKPFIDYLTDSGTTKPLEYIRASPEL